jgi:hypothetical protein
MYQVIYMVLLAGTCALAFWNGDLPERIGGTIFLAASFLSPALQAAEPFASPELGIMAVDIAALAMLVALALASDRFWPLWATSFHLIATVSHVAATAKVAVPAAYAINHVFWAYPMLLSLLAGTIVEAGGRRSK